jgi:hypothetical protein
MKGYNFLNQAYLALADAAKKYRQEVSETRFSTVFAWFLQKYFEKLCPMNERQAEISYPNGVSQIISYAKLQKIKKGLPQGTETRIVSSSTEIFCLSTPKELLPKAAAIKVLNFFLPVSVLNVFVYP